MAIAELSSVLGVITGRLSDNIYRIGASIVGISTLGGWTFGGISGPLEAGAAGLDRLGAPHEWVYQVMTWVEAHDSIVGVLGQVLLATGFVALLRAKSWTRALSQRSTGTIWVGMALIWATSEPLSWTVLPVLCLLVVAFIPRSGGTVKEALGESAIRVVTGMAAGLIYGPLWIIGWLISVPKPDREVSVQRRSDSDES